MTDIPKVSPWARALDAQRDKQSLWDRLFGSHDQSVPRTETICGPIRKTSERGRER